MARLRLLDLPQSRRGAGGGYDQGLLLGRGFPGFQIIAPSRFGYLGTPTPQEISAAAQADAHAALLDGLGVSRMLPVTAPGIRR